MKDNDFNALYGAMLDRIMLSAMSDAEYREGAPLVKAARRFANVRKCDEAGELYDLVECLRKQGALNADQRARSAALISLSREAHALSASQGARSAALIQSSLGA